MKRNRVVLMIVVAIMLIATTVLAEFRANPIITRSKATLLSNKTATLSVVAKMDCEVIGTVSYTLYQSDGSVVKSETIDDYSSNYYKHTTNVDLSGYIHNGNSYYITAYFYADGETSNATSGIRNY